MGYATITKCDDSAGELGFSAFGHEWGTSRSCRNPQTRMKPRADDGTRTHDTWLGKPVLYQLSYVRARDRF
jgi:hypothetical protein